MGRESSVSVTPVEQGTSFSSRELNPRLTASSTGLLLKTLGLRVTAIKIDPYMNIDAGTMSPTEHGRSISTGWKREMMLTLGLL